MRKGSRCLTKLGRPELPGTILHSVLTSAVFCSNSFSFTSTTIPPSFSSSGLGLTSMFENNASPFTFLKAFFPASMLKIWPAFSCKHSHHLLRHENAHILLQTTEEYNSCCDIRSSYLIYCGDFRRTFIITTT